MQLIEQIRRVNNKLAALNIPSSVFTDPLIQVKQDKETALVMIETGARAMPDDSYELHGLQLLIESKLEKVAAVRGRTPGYNERNTIALILYSNSLISIESIKTELSKLAEVKLIKVEYSPDAVNSQYLKLQKEVNRTNYYLAAITYELTGPVKSGC